MEIPLSRVQPNDCVSDMFWGRKKHKALFLYDFDCLFCNFKLIELIFVI